MINLELIDLCIKGTFCGCAFVQNKEASNAIEIFSQVLLYLIFTTATCIEVKFICILISIPSKPSMGNPNDLIAFVMLATFCSLPFVTCNRQLQGMTAQPPALLFFAHFCAE